MHDCRGLPVVEALQIDQVQDLAVVGLKSVQSLVQKDFALCAQIRFFQAFLLPGQILQLLRRSGEKPGAVPEAVHGHISADGVKPCLERTSAPEPGFSGGQLYKSLFHQLLRHGEILCKAVQVQNQSVLVISDNFDNTLIITIKETAVATCTVVH